MTNGNIPPRISAGPLAEIPADSSELLAFANQLMSAAVTAETEAGRTGVSAEQRERLSMNSTVLFMVANGLRTQSLVIGLANTEAALKGLAAQVDKAEDFMRTVQTVRDVLTLVSAVVPLAVAVATGNVGAAAESSFAVFKAIRDVADTENTGSDDAVVASVAAGGST